MDDKSDATNESVANDNKIGTINKYGPNNNESGATCCCNVSIETGTKVAAIVLCGHYMIEAMKLFFGLLFMLQNIWIGMLSLVVAFVCLLVLYAQKERNPLLFMPYLILGVHFLIEIAWVIFELIICGYTIYNFCTLERRVALILAARIKSFRTVEFLLQHGCTVGVISVVWSILWNGWLYSIILRGFLAVKEVESRRSRPAV